LQASDELGQFFSTTESYYPASYYFNHGKNPDASYAAWKDPRRGHHHHHHHLCLSTLTVTVQVQCTVNSVSKARKAGGAYNCPYTKNQITQKRLINR